MVIAFLSVMAAAATATATPIDRSSWFTASDYPVEAMKKGLEGAVTFEVDVDTDGKPTACRITKSSGRPILDQTTCEVARLRAHFKPAVDSNGTAVPGRYSTSAIWKLAGGSTPNFHHAVILDFSDPDHPACKIETNAPSGAGGLPTCDQVLAQGPLMQTLGRRFIKAIFLEANAFGDQEPYRGEPDWGVRLSYLASEHYLLKGSAACISIAAEGGASGKDPCGNFPGPRSISETDKKNALKIRSEAATFGVPRKVTSRPGKCRSGESAAEVMACE